MVRSYTLAAGAAVLALSSGLSIARAQNNLPPIPMVNCPLGTAPRITRFGGGGVNFGKVGVGLPSYTKVECMPIMIPILQPSPAPSPSPKK